MFGLALADSEQYRKIELPILYISNDSDEATVAQRLYSRRTGIPSHLAEEILQNDPKAAAQALSDASHIRWSFDSSPSLKDIEEEIEAFEELFGEPPHLIVVDILYKVDHVEDSEHTSINRVVSYLDFLARESGACVLIIHHTSERTRGTGTQGRSDILQQVARLPVLMLTLAYRNGILSISPVKNRHGTDDFTGQTSLQLWADPSTCTMGDRRSW